MNGQPDNKRHLSDIARNQVELKDIKNIMIGNIDKITNRGDNLNELHDSCDQLEVQAARFQTTSKKVEKMVFCQNVKFQLAIALIAALFLTILVSLVLLYFLVIKQ